MGSFKYIHANEMAMYKNDIRKKEILQDVRKQPIMTRVDKPTKITRAKSVGYKAKQGYVVVRVRVGKGDFRRPRPNHARRPSKSGIYYKLAVSKEQIARNRVSKVFKNMKVVGSYFLIEDGKSKWFEVILVDKTKI
ncbi:MAG: Ribosomal protein L15e [Candidatus Parvarchaeum acidophilus ARMAN-5]|jgi:large subunit ribosomal protein L15e|uniref:50S ribosomal protein L15e n=1 Tax=Candidatus Parvarchaeum acidophilus ARMAN-5 TaxID=662762 RepID=D6GV13_PARA5|nr:MAG: Ribosomal protein L15e [Candidatus Parvarchaeum acidophilus ARMAN-5]